MDRVHLEFIGNGSRYIHTQYAFPIPLLFIPHKFLVRMMIKFRRTKEKEEEEDTKKAAATKRLSIYFNKRLCEKI